MTVLQIQHSDSRLDVRLNRPEKRNALNSELIKALTEVFESVNADSDVKVIVLSGNGKDFSSGADLESVRKIADSSFEENLADATELLRLFIAIRKCPVPVIAMVQGNALAGGCGLATACDMVIATDDAVFGYPEVNIGFVPAMVSAISRRNLSEKRAFELLTTGRRFNSQEALEFGLINKTVVATQIEKVTAELAETYVRLPKGAVAATKALLYEIDDRSFTESLEIGAKVNATARMTDECKKGIERFLNKK